MGNLSPFRYFKTTPELIRLAVNGVRPISAVAPQCGHSSDGAVAQQSGREFASAASTTRTSDAPVPAHAESAEIRPPFTPPFTTFSTTNVTSPAGTFSAQPNRHSRRVASDLRCLKTGVLGPTETGSPWSDGVDGSHRTASPCARLWGPQTTRKGAVRCRKYAPLVWIWRRGSFSSTASTRMAMSLFGRSCAVAR